MAIEYGATIKIEKAKYAGDGIIEAIIRVIPEFSLAEEQMKPVLDGLATMIAASMEAEQLEIGSGLVVSGKEGETEPPKDPTVN